jgi:hypothetical protein
MDLFAIFVANDGTPCSSSVRSQHNTSYKKERKKELVRLNEDTVNNKREGKTVENASYNRSSGLFCSGQGGGRLGKNRD